MIFPLVDTLVFIQLYTKELHMNGSDLQKWSVIVTLMSIHSVLSAQEALKTEQPYHWKSVQIVGGGFVDSGRIFKEYPLILPEGLPEQNRNRGDTRGGQDRLYAAPGREGDLWIEAFDGLYHSVDSGNLFSKMKGVQEIHGFGFGRGTSESGYAALYLIGVVDDLRGIFRSDNIAESWTRINDDQHQWGLLLYITGDPRQYGRVYVGTHGRGIITGDPVDSR